MSLQNDAIYGDAPNRSMMSATMLNSGQAQDSFDWGAVLANGIRGAAQGAMAASVNGAYASGQLVAPNYQNRGQGVSLVPLLVIGGILYAVANA